MLGGRDACWTAIPVISSVSANSFNSSTQPDFNERFFRLFDADWQELCEEWQLMVANMEYGYDVERSCGRFHARQNLPSARLRERGRG